MKNKVITYDQKTVGAKCKALRLKLGVSQAQVALETNSKQSAVSMFESGKMTSSKILIWYVKKGVEL